MSRRKDKRRSGIQNENQKLEREIEELEDALILHQRLRGTGEGRIKSLIRKEIGGSRWEHGGQGKLQTYKSSRDLEDTTKLQEDPGIQDTLRKPETKQTTSETGLAERNRSELRTGDMSSGSRVVGSGGSRVCGSDPKLVKVGSVERVRSSARARRDRLIKEQQKANKRPTPGKVSSQLNNERPEKETNTERKTKTSDETKKDPNQSLFASEPLQIDNLKDKVLKKVSASVIKRPAPPDISEVLKVQDKTAASARIESLLDKPGALPPAKKKDGTDSGKREPNRRARGARHAQAQIEDYVNMVTGTSSKSKNKLDDAKDSTLSNVSEFHSGLDLIQTRPLNLVPGDELRTVIDEVERVNMNNQELGSNAHLQKASAREVLTSDYSSDLEMSPDRWDDPQIGGACFDRESWLSSMQRSHMTAKGTSSKKGSSGVKGGSAGPSGVDGTSNIGSSRARPRGPALSDDISDTPILGGLMVNFRQCESNNVSLQPLQCDPAVVSWLESIGLRDTSRYVKVFAENEIDMECVKDLTQEQLNLMGITAVGPVNKILRAVSVLKPDPLDVNVDQLLAAVDSNLNQSRQKVPEKGVNNFPQKRAKKNKNEFIFSDFAGEEGRDEIKIKLKDNLRKKSCDDETNSVLNSKIQSYDKEELLKETKSIDSRRRLKRTESLLDDSKSADVKSVTSVRRRSSSATRVQPDRERSLSSEGSTRGRQPSHHRPSPQLVPKGLPTGKKTNKEGESKTSIKINQKNSKSAEIDGDSESKPLSRNNQKRLKSADMKENTESKTQSKNSQKRVKSADIAKNHVMAGISSAAQRREEMQKKSKMEKSFDVQDNGRRRRRDKMAARHTGRGRLDSRGSLQPPSKRAELEEDPLDNFTLPEDPGNLGRRSTSDSESESEEELDDFPIRIQAIPAKHRPEESLSLKHSLSSSRSRTEESGSSREKVKDDRDSLSLGNEPSSSHQAVDEESLSARERIQNVDLMVKNLQRKSLDKQALTLGIVRDLQKQLEDIEKSLVTKTAEEIQNQPLSASPKEDKSHVEDQEIPDKVVSPKPRTSSRQTKSGRTVQKISELAEASDTLHDLMPKKSKNKEPDHSSVLTHGPSLKSKVMQSIGVASMSMSKRELLNEIRKEKDDHRKQIRHLQSELTRLQHKDPVRKEEVDIRDIHYTEEDLLGEGAFSQVFRGEFQGAEVAVKRLKVPLSSQDKNYFAAEVSLLRDLRHPRVVLLIGVCTARRLPVMVLEFMSKGNLFGLLHNPNRESLDHAEYYQIARDIAAGMVYLHNHRPSVLHLDLKSMNVLIGPMDRAKIADFGFSKLKHAADQKAAKTKVKEEIQGSPAWMAPELLQAGEVTPKADVYSFGVILWEMLTRLVPYQGCSMFQILERVRLNKRPEIPVECPQELASFISRCWDQNPAKRPMFKEVLSTLENLSFPPEWRDLFHQAGVPREALENVQSTRNIISLVTSTLESTKLASLLDVAGQGQGQVDVVAEESESESTEVEEELDESAEESSDLSDDSLESETQSTSKGSSRQGSAHSGRCAEEKTADALNTDFQKMSLRSSDNVSTSSAKEDRSVNVNSNEDFTALKVVFKERIKSKDMLSPSPRSATPKSSNTPTPRRSREAWSVQDIVPTVTNFPHNHIPPPPAPPPPPTTVPPAPQSSIPPPPPPPPTTNSEPTEGFGLPKPLVTPQVLEAKSLKLKSHKRDRDTKKVTVKPRVTPKPVKSALFAVGASDLVQQRDKLKPTQRPHPNQLQDLGQVNRVMLSSIAEILRDAMSERRFAMGERPSASCDLDLSQSDVSWSTQDD